MACTCMLLCEHTCMNVRSKLINFVTLTFPFNVADVSIP